MCTTGTSCATPACSNLLVNLLKPLVHHDVTNRTFRKECLVNATDTSCDELLALLQKHAELDHRLLPKLKS